MYREKEKEREGLEEKKNFHGHIHPLMYLSLPDSRHSSYQEERKRETERE